MKEYKEYIEIGDIVLFDDNDCGVIVDTPSMPFPYSIVSYRVLEGKDKDTRKSKFITQIKKNFGWGISFSEIKEKYPEYFI
jgi:hypothetical protein